MVVPHRLRKPLFHQSHSGPLATHLGAQRTFLQLRTAYYCPGMTGDVVRWSKECDACAQCKGPPTRRQGKLQKVLTGAPLDIVAVDVLSGLPVTPDGKKHILVLTDYFTMWSCAFALPDAGPDAEASTCMRAMYDSFFSEFGLPKQLHSDLGKNFESKLFYELCLIAGVNKWHTTPFHPQSDGQTERMNRTLLQMLKTTADENPGTCPQRLATVMTAYRMTVHKTTGVTPNMAMLGREVMMPAALIARPPVEPYSTTVPFVSNLRDASRDAHRRVRVATKSSARTQKSYCDERARVASFDVGQHVWLFWPRPPVRQRFRKLQRLWTRPWRIEAFKSPLVVVIKHTAKRTRQTVHVDRLLLCKTPPPAVPDVDSGVPPDSQTETNGLDTPDERSQSLPGLNQDSQSWGDDESQSQSQSASGSGQARRWPGGSRGPDPPSHGQDDL